MPLYCETTSYNSSPNNTNDATFFFNSTYEEIIYILSIKVIGWQEPTVTIKKGKNNCFFHKRNNIISTTLINNQS